MAEVKGLKNWQRGEEKPASSGEKRGMRERSYIQRQTFTLSDLLIDLARNKMNQLFDNAVRGGCR